MQIRRIYDLDGGNHVECNKLQVRDEPGQPWRDLGHMSSYDAMIADLAEGILDYDDIDYLRIDLVKADVEKFRLRTGD